MRLATVQHTRALRWPGLFALLLSSPWAIPVAMADSGPIDPLSPGYIVQLVVSLAVVLGLMFALVWVLKRFGRLDARSRNYPLKVLTQISVGPRERIALVEVGDQQMLVGITPGGVEALGWVDPPINPADPDMPQGFAQALQQQMGERLGIKKKRGGA